MKLFISYRRDDAQMVSGRLRQSLAEHLGEDAIFLDTSSILAGDNWQTAIDHALTKDAVVLVLIGPNWANVEDKDKQGARRIDNPEDWVRKELEYAFNRSIKVIPLLVDRAKMPEASVLP